MAEELKELIEKIQAEGFKAAEEKAALIEAEARRKAEDLIKKSEKEAARVETDANDRINRAEEGAKNSIKQAGRDTILSLKKEISAMLERLAEHHVHKALGAEEMAKILTTVIKGCGGEGMDKIVVSVRKEDIAAVEAALMAELGAEVKKSITIRTTGELRGGFVISYDGGRSCYDFSDKALAEYLASYLKPKLAELLKESVSK